MGERGYRMGCCLRCRPPSCAFARGFLVGAADHLIHTPPLHPVHVGGFFLFLLFFFLFPAPASSFSFVPSRDFSSFCSVSRAAPAALRRVAGWRVDRHTMESIWQSSGSEEEAVSSVESAVHNPNSLLCCRARSHKQACLPCCHTKRTLERERVGRSHQSVATRSLPLRKTRAITDEK